MSKARLLETVFIEDIHSKIDRENGVIHDAKIIGKLSKNGYAYSDHALKGATGLYEGVHIYEDHPDKSQPGVERKMGEKIGWFENVQWKADGIYGDFFYLKSHPRAEMILEWAERNPRGIGFSHNAEGEMRSDPQGGRYVESINRVRSVDLVGVPATTDSLFESVEEQEEILMKTTLGKLIESHGSASEKKHVALLEAAVLDIEVEIPEPGDDATGVVASGFKAAYSQLAESSLEEQVKRAGELFHARTALETGKVPVQESHQPDEDAETISELKEQVKALKTDLELKDLLESHGVKATPVELKMLARCDTKEERIEFIEGLKERGKPAASGRQEQKTTFEDAKSEFASLRN